MAQLFEQYRPQSWHEVVGQDEALQRINTIRQRGLSGRAWWISGKSGTGKSSIAAAFALAACKRGERCLYFAFEESAAQHEVLGIRP